MTSMTFPPACDLESRCDQTKGGGNGGGGMRGHLEWRNGWPMLPRSSTAAERVKCGKMTSSIYTKTGSQCRCWKRASELIWDWHQSVWEDSDSDLRVLRQWSERAQTVVWEDSDSGLRGLWQWSERTQTVVWEDSDSGLRGLRQWSKKTQTVV